MTPKPNTTRRAAARPTQAGLTLVELLVALVLSLLVLGGLIQLFTSSRQAARVVEGISRMQDSGRFAMDALAFDIRQAGFKGSCMQPVNVLLNLGGDATLEMFYDLDAAVQGWDNTSGTPDHGQTLTGYVAGTDVIMIRSASVSTGLTANGNTPRQAGNINLTGPSGQIQGEIVLVASPEGCDLFQNVSSANATNLSRGGAGGFSPGNLNPSGGSDCSAANANCLSTQYDDRMEILFYRASIFYIGTGASGLPTLMRQTRAGSAQGIVTEELVDGILNMQILYGVDTSGDREADVFQNASGITNWNNVVAVRMGLLAISTEGRLATEAQVLPMQTDTNTITQITVPDQRLGQVFTSTVGIRNRLP